MSVNHSFLFLFNWRVCFCENEVILKGFNCQKLGGKKKEDNNHQISIFGFKCIAIKHRRFINDLYSISGL